MKALAAIRALGRVRMLISLRLTLPVNRSGLPGIEMNDKLLGDIAARLAQLAANNPTRAIVQLPSQRGFTPGSGCR